MSGETHGVPESELGDPDIVRCEVCDLPHRRKAVRCDQCGHSLGELVDWDALRNELPTLRLKVLAGLALLVLMLVVNLVAFHGQGYILTLAPIGWVVFSGYRHHVVGGVLRARRAAGRD